MPKRISWTKRETLMQSYNILKEIAGNKEIYLYGQVIENKVYSLES
jgi:hypothetical protein